MDTNEAKLLFKDEVFQIIGGAIVFNSIVVDTKIIDRITDHERGLMLNYLRITNLRVGVILNFKHRKLEWSELSYELVSIRVHSWCLIP
jgi:GxxExxY protein